MKAVLFRLENQLDCSALGRFVAEVADRGLTQARAVIVEIRVPILANVAMLSLLESTSTRLLRNRIRLIVVSPAGDIAALIGESAFPGLRRIRFVTRLTEALRIAHPRREGPGLDGAR